MLLNQLEHLTVWIGLDFVNLNLAFEKRSLTTIFLKLIILKGKGGLRLFIHYIISKTVLDRNHEL